MRRLVVRALIAFLCLIALALPLAPVRADERLLERQQAAVDRAISWLRMQQQPDGSFPTAFGHPAGITLDVLQALIVAGVDPATWRGAEKGPDVLSYLVKEAEAYATSPAATGKLVAALTAAGLDVQALNGFDAAAKLASFAEKDGALPEASTLADQAWAILGLVSLRQPIAEAAVKRLLEGQNADGGWGWAKGQPSDADSTALALEALAAAGRNREDPVIKKALAHLKSLQGPTGAIEGWGAPNPSSTAYVLQALVAVGEDPLSEAWRTPNGQTLLDGLLALQTAEGGFASFEGKPDVFSTAQAIPGLLGKPFPLPGPVPALRGALAYLRSIQGADGGFGEALTGEVIMALAAAGEDPQLWQSRAGRTLVEAALDLAPKADNAGKAGRLALALAKAGRDPHRAGSVDLIAVIQAHYDRTTGLYDPSGNVWNQAYALWALAETGSQVPQEAIAWLVKSQNPDGGWGWNAAAPSDSNSAALAVLALRACGYPAESKELVKAAAYLRNRQANDGGYRYDSSTQPPEGDANSTALVAQALAALGIETHLGWQCARSAGLTVNRPLDRVHALQLGNGALEWLPGNGENPLATAQIIPFLAHLRRGEVKPLAATAPAGEGKVAPTASEVAIGEWAGSIEAWRKGMTLAGYTIPQPTTPITTGLAALVAQFDADRYVVRVVPLYGASPSGWEALQAAGLALVTQQGFVCSLGGVGCSAENCFCDKTNFWGYWHHDDQAWEMASTGASDYTLTHRAIEGWRWGAGDPPVEVKVEDIFNPSRLAPGVPRVSIMGGRLSVRVDYLGDVDEDAQVTATLSPARGAQLSAPLRRFAALGLFVGALEGNLPSGEQTLCLSYTDPDGVNGATSWCTPVNVP